MQLRFTLHSKVVVAATAVAVPGGIISVDLKNEIQASCGRLKFYGDKDGGGGWSAGKYI